MKKDEAGTIVTDVPNGDAGGTIVADVPTDDERVLNNPRMAAMSQIKVDREDVVADGLNDAQPGDDAAAVSDDSGKPGDDDKGQVAVAPEAMVEVIVNGVSKLVPVSEMVKGYQIESVARENLRKASEVLKEAERIKTAAVTTTPAAAPVTPETLKGALDLLVEGETGEAAKQLAGIFTAPAAAPEVNLQDAVERVLSSKENAKIYDSFLDDYKELSDPDVYEVCDRIYVREFEAKVAAGEISYDEALRKSGDMTRQKFNLAPAAAGAGEVKQDRAVTVAANKQRINNIQTAGARLPAATGDKPKSTADVILEMRKKRGLS